MRRHPLIDQIDGAMRELSYRCHRFFVESGLSKNRLSGLAGVSDTLLRGIERPGFTASFRTLARIEAVIPDGWEPQEPFDDGSERIEIDRQPLDRHLAKDPEGRHNKVGPAAHVAHELPVDE